VRGVLVVSKTKISNIELEQLVRQGLGVSEIARKVGVSKGTVSSRLKALKVAINQRVVLHDAGEIVERKLDAVAQLEKINQAINVELDRIQEDLKEAKGDGRLALQMIQIKHSEEVRKQLALQLEIFKALYDMAAVAEFQKEVLTAIGEASPDVRDKIIHNLQKARAIRSTLEFNQRPV
jgi:AcrR family transcriptional regulator